MNLFGETVRPTVATCDGLYLPTVGGIALGLQPGAVLATGPIPQTLSINAQSHIAMNPIVQRALRLWGRPWGRDGAEGRLQPPNWEAAIAGAGGGWGVVVMTRFHVELSGECDGIGEPQSKAVGETLTQPEGRG